MSGSAIDVCANKSSKSAGFFSATCFTTSATNCLNSSFLATKSVSALTSTTAPTFPSSDTYPKTSPSAAILSDFFAADIFSCDPENTETKSQINNWIKQKTNSLITDFYDGAPFVSMVINALYFNGTWKVKFAKEDTEKEKFYVGEKIYMVDMMKRLRVNEEIAEGRNFTACRRDFGNGAYTCTFILPEEGCDINDFIAALSYDELSSLKFSSRKCDLSVPKFELGNKFDNLVQIFSALGIYGIDTPIELSPENIIATVLHESYIKLDEEGAKVAAVTGDDIYWEALDPNKVLFCLNRPFIFMINETSTNACILAGRISKFK